MWKHSFFNSLPTKKATRLHNIVNASYTVIREFCVLEFNNVQCKHNAVSRFKQIVFEMMYTDFRKMSGCDEQLQSFQAKWNELNFLLRLLGDQLTFEFKRKIRN